jgi:S-adenosylmethionine:tRNA ribosyltransferase-isomerase
LHLDDFDYELPQSAIATHPTTPRDASRLLVLEPGGGVAHRAFRDIGDYVRPGDALVLNETRVRHARLIGRRESGGKVDALLLGPHPNRGYSALVKPARRMKVGEVVRLDTPDGVEAGLVFDAREDDGRWRVHAESAAGVELDPDVVGHPALPPYLGREPEPEDRERYQTVFAREPGAVAAPTAGLHFTPELLDALQSVGVAIVRVVLHVGIGTFRPVTAEDPRAHEMESEFYRVSAEAATTLRRVRAAGGRVIAVGTTAARVLETVGPDTDATEGWTDLFLYPPYRFRALDGLITNFHLPRSTLLMLVSALIGRERMMEAYATARDAGYRFYSYGDAMFILPGANG